MKVHFAKADASFCPPENSDKFSSFVWGLKQNKQNYIQFDLRLIIQRINCIAHQWVGRCLSMGRKWPHSRLRSTLQSEKWKCTFQGQDIIAVSHFDIVCFHWWPEGAKNEKKTGEWIKKCDGQECTRLVSITRGAIWIDMIRGETTALLSGRVVRTWDAAVSDTLLSDNVLSPTTFWGEVEGTERLMVARLPLRKTDGKRSRTQHRIARRQARLQERRETAPPTHAAWIRFLASDCSLNKKVEL